MGASAVNSTSEDRLEDLCRVRNTSLLGRWTGAWIELLAILESFRSLLVQSVLLREHIDNQIDLFPDRIATFHSILIIAEVAQRGYFVHVAFELDYGWWRSIFDDEFDSCQALQDSSPLHSLRL